MKLSELDTGKSGTIVKVRGHGAFRKRISEMGFIKGKSVKVIKNAPLLDPVQYSIMGYEISLRKAEAGLIEIINETQAETKSPEFLGTLEHLEDNAFVKKAEKTINIALVGNPNSGKTSVFNSASRSTEHVGNYSGVTVDSKLAKIEFQGYTFNIFDLPGTYSLSSYSPEEVYVRNFISEQFPDIILNVLDATNLERNLFLTTQLVDLNQRMVIALNMYDELKKSEDKFDYISFGKLLGIPVIPTVGSKGKGLAQLFTAIIQKFNESEREKKNLNINFGQDVEKSICTIREKIFIPENFHVTARQCARFMSIKLLEKDSEILGSVNNCINSDEIRQTVETEIKSLEQRYEDQTENLITDARYGFIAGALKETYQYNNSDKVKKSEKIDTILTNKFLAIPIFFGFLWLMFISTFKIGQYPMAWIDQSIAWVSAKVMEIMTPGDFQSLVVDGIIGGVGGIIIFLPNIIILFLFISFMEDSGYMARAAFIMDRLMHKIGLHGKSFIPLVMGFGCNVPAIMSTRIIESRNNRLLTMLILPFMSCSARLPVYILIISAFFPSHQGTVLFGIYMTGILMAVISSILFKKLFFKKEDSPFVMELPPYRMPTTRNVLRHTWSKSYEYLQKIGGIILVASIIIWGLNHYPNNSRITGGVSAVPEHSQEGSEKSHVVKGHSYLEGFGRFIQPVMAPLGFDWKMTVAILAGIPGKEVIVSTLGVIYEDEGKNESLAERIKNDKYTSGEKTGQSVFSTASALAFLIFILIYFPCVAVIATIARESGKLSWAAFVILYTTVFAWLSAFIVYNAGSLIF
jgi:ferrous iron transport protein B